MPDWFRRFINVIVQIGGWALLGAAFMVTYDVITRKLFNMSIGGADEISGYIFAVATACAFSYALVSRSNIRIDLLYNVLPERLQRTCDVIAIAATTGYFLVLSWFAYGLVADAFYYNSHAITPLQTPLAIPQSAWFAALVLATLTAGVLTIRSLIALLRGQMKTVAGLVGMPSISEEIREELGQTDTPSGTDRE